MYSLELHPELPIFPAHEPGSASKRTSQGPPSGAGFSFRADANTSGPAYYSPQVSTPGGAESQAQDQDQTARESSTESVPPSWPKVGKGCLAGLKVGEEDLRDKGDFEAFSVTTYNTEGRKVIENGVPVEATAGLAVGAERA